MHNTDYDAELLICIEFICATIVSNNFADYFCCIAGDFNASWECIESNSKCVSLFNLLTDLRFSHCSKLYCDEIKYTFCCEARDVFSWLDDVFIKTSVTNSISAISFDALDDSCKFSDHMVIMSELEFMGDIKGKDIIEIIR